MRKILLQTSFVAFLGFIVWITTSFVLFPKTEIKKPPTTRTFSTFVTPHSQESSSLAMVPTIELTDNDIKALPIISRGYGSDATGGRGGSVIQVTNLNDGGPGSFRDAIQQSGTRNIIFRVGGTINATTYYDVDDPNYTIWGNTAPGDGILIREGELRLEADNGIVMGMKLRQGPGSTGSNEDCINIRPDSGQNITKMCIAFNSISWGVDESIGTNSFAGTTARNVGFYNNMIGESTYGLLVFSDIAKVGVYQNAFILNWERNARVNRPAPGLFDFEEINNIIHGANYAIVPSLGAKFSVINNVYTESSEASAATTSLVQAAVADAGYALEAETYAYITGNDIAGVNVNSSNLNPYLQGSPFETTGYEIIPTSSIDVTKMGDIFHPRDAVDTRLINAYNNGNGTRTTSGTFPSINGGTPYADSNNNGLGDAYEAANGGPVQSDRPATVILKDGTILDQSGVTNYAAEGYTHLEIFLNDLSGNWDDFERVGVGNDQLKINNIPETISAYAPVAQDNGAFEILNNDNTLKLSGNAWKKADLNYTITANTVLEFDLKVTGLGEIHGIAFDNDNALGGETLFQFAGTQTDYGLQGYNTYSGNDWVHFTVPIGEHITGDYNYIVFAADKDSSPGLQESSFRNIVLNEGTTGLTINGTVQAIDAYAPGSQDSGTFEIQDGGNTLRLMGNAWKKAMFDYTVTPNTIMEFDLKVLSTGEIHGIAFDNDDTLGGEMLFQFAGTQSDYGHQDYATYSGNDWVHFAIPVGEHFTGTYNNIVFVADDDSSPSAQESFFRNIVFNEGVTGLNINGVQEMVDAYDPVGQDAGSFEIQDGGNTIRLTGNAWKKAPFNYTVTSNTVLEFDLMVTGTGEIHGIAFDNNDTLGSELLFQFAGTQDNYGLQDYNTYSGNGWVHFAIPVGGHFTGTYNNIVFVADDDSPSSAQESFFRNIVLNENSSSNLSARIFGSEEGGEPYSFLFPNKAKTFATLVSSGEIKDVALYAINGSLVKKVASKATTNIEIALHDIPDGLYIVRFRTNDSIQSKKLVVEH